MMEFDFVAVDVVTREDMHSLIAIDYTMQITTNTHC